MPRVRLVVAVVAAALLGAGCLGRSPSTQYYALTALAAAEGGAPESAGGGPAVRVGPAQLPRFLDRPQLARRTSGSTVAYDEYHRWAASLNAELLRVVGENLAALLPSDRVVVYPADAPFPLDYRVVLDVERFEAGVDDVVTLRVRWAVLPGGKGDAIAVARTGADYEASSGRAEDLVAAHSEAADALSRAIAARIRALHDEAPRAAESP